MSGFWGFIIIILFAVIIYNVAMNSAYKKLTKTIWEDLGIFGWKYLNHDDLVELRSARAVDNYEPIQYFKDNKDRVNNVKNVLTQKSEYEELLRSFLDKNEYRNKTAWSRVERDIQLNLRNLDTYVVLVQYVSPAGRSFRQKTICFNMSDIGRLTSDPSQLMSKSEYNKFLKDQNKSFLENKQHEYYDRVNSIIDCANESRSGFVVESDKDELDSLIGSLYEKTVNSIKKIKELNSAEWLTVGKYISTVKESVDNIIKKNKQIIDYYASEEFNKIKSTCESLMSSQRDFNEYIDEKVKSIAGMFGKRIMRNDTEITDEYDYIRPYKKEITPFTAEVSAQVFASAENSPMEYIIKYFYPNKEKYPEQINKLKILIEELETLKDAKSIIDNYKREYQQYIKGVPNFIFENDEDGFYSRLGFANISEKALTIEYKFSYTSHGGMAQRNFSIPMTENTIMELIDILQSKLSMSSFTKEQRALMTSKLRQHIKERDNYTCKNCGNSTHKEPNLLLEIDHIVPVSKGGFTEENNLQTLCWRCNRSKGNKSI